MKRMLLCAAAAVIAICVCTPAQAKIQVDVAPGRVHVQVGHLPAAVVKKVIQHHRHHPRHKYVERHWQ